MIYILHSDPSECAKLLDDKALGKMISAIAQVLCNVHYMQLISSGLENIEKNKVAPMLWSDYRKCKWSHWASECLANYNALLAYAQACCDEYKYRNWDDYTRAPRDQKKHKHHDVIRWCELNWPALPRSSTYELFDPECKLGETTPFPLVMPEKYKEIAQNVIQEDFTSLGYIESSYRTYYKAKLREMARERICCADKQTEMCCICAPTGYITQAPTFTRREIPSWLGDL